MERKIDAAIMDWKNDPEHKALLVKGCRQVGKTYSVESFLKQNYRSFIKVNLEDEPRSRELFDNKNITGGEIIDRLLFDHPVNMFEGESAIFLDEIQCSSAAYSSLKGLVSDGRYDIIASGSLLGVKIDDLQRLTPTGYVNIINMKSMDFEEYLWAMGFRHEDTEYLRSCISDMKPIDGYVLSAISDQFRRYVAIGGMPAAVREYSNTHDYSRASSVLRDILTLLTEDSQKYSKGTDRMKIERCFQSVPVQLGQNNPKFMYSRIEKKKGVGKRTYQPSLLWLKNAGLVEMCTNLTELTSPLKNHSSEESFKLYLSDTGLMCSMLGGNIGGEIVNHDPYANNGAVMENAVACELVRKGYDLHFYGKPDSTMDIDFIEEIQGKVTALEIKSGRNRKSRSLNQVFVKNRSVRRAMKLSESNISIDQNGVEHLPLFAVCFLPDADRMDLRDSVGIDDVKRRIDELTCADR